MLSNILKIYEKYPKFNHNIFGTHQIHTEGVYLNPVATFYSLTN